jgi:hypothetical protein
MMKHKFQFLANDKGKVHSIVLPHYCQCPSSLLHQLNKHGEAYEILNQNKI